MTRIAGESGDKDRPALLFCNNWPGQLDHDAHLAEAAWKRYGLSSIVLTDGPCDPLANRVGFHKVVDLGQPRHLGAPTDHD